jgi:hypothetical protein
MAFPAAAAAPSIAAPAVDQFAAVADWRSFAVMVSLTSYPVMRLLAP